MNFRINISKDEERQGISISASVLLHVFIFFTAGMILSIQPERTVRSNFVQVSTGEYINQTAEKTEEIKEQEPTPTPTQEQEQADETEYGTSEAQEPVIEKKPLTESSPKYYSFNSNIADTNGLEQVYSERTLNVSLKYPAGWTYIDQNVKNKLDGVTFWMPAGNINPPPYVHLEVKEKYLFNPSRFKYETKTRSFSIFYNDPVELEGQVSQVFYIRTDTDEDYSLKLIIKGRETFKQFQPAFFGMIKTFRFGSSLF